jgi:hypothetical protein
MAVLEDEERARLKINFFQSFFRHLIYGLGAPIFQKYEHKNDEYTKIIEEKVGTFKYLWRK